MKIKRHYLKTSFLFILLTILTQTGGIIYLIYKPFSNFIKRKYSSKIQCLSFRIAGFLLLFSVFSFLITPLVATAFGRVPLPVFMDEEYPLRPANFVTCFTNRHYVKPELLTLIKEISKEFNEGKLEKTEIIYLDANFPFINGFPLLPHKSHDDGEKLDICFLFKEKGTEKRINEPMSFWGYGACIEPENGETNMPLICSKKGYFQYSLLKVFTSQSKINSYEFDEAANKALIQLIASKKPTGKIFIEPHLKERLDFEKNEKVRFHGCGAVRHDDHIHFQL